MNSTLKYKFLVITLTSIAILLTGCGKNDTEVTETSDPVAPNSILLSEAPAFTITVGQARKEAQPGQKVNLVGQVGGVLNPIAENYASFVIADEAVLFCDEMGDDGCSTPWDACCENPDKLSSLRASIVFLNENGLPMNIDLRKEANLSELNLVTVKGTVASESTPQNLIIHASRIYNNSIQ